MRIHTNCIFCKSDKIKLLPGYERVLLCKCKACDLVFVLRIPEKQELIAYYEDYGVDNYLSPLTVKRYNELLDKFESFRKTNRILDVGCGIGYFLIEAKKRGWEVYGTEFSDSSASICEEKGIKIHRGELKKDLFEEGYFDIITSFEVIEHINNPNEELELIHDFLRPGGLFYITTPNFNSLLRLRLKITYNIFVYPEHLTFYTASTIEKVLNKAGFKKKKIETTGISLTRLRLSSGRQGKIIAEDSDDERIRTQLDTRWILRNLKVVINKLLTVFKVGDSLKVWFVK